jgi:uncharacterized LabA/DUF88 family protein
MKRIVLIDGENLVRAVRNLLGSEKKPASREELTNFNFKQLIDEVLDDQKKAQILFFGARLRRYDMAEDVLQQSEKAIRLQAQFVNNLQKQGISFIKVGHLRARETKPCRNCGHISWQLIEKGVDVGLGVRMVTEADSETEIIMFSADTDLVPAVKSAVKLGAVVTYVGYEYQPVLALSKVATATRLITKQMAQRAYNG